ncbi:hypothetical protein N7495_010015 [Penicillium taxi]|uniref:uncharacterized protein n=1 Tax=Penicillium taxi TaxID=168475 RepID=UPI002545B8E1|nr:uncharacterized protein N7495_010015 [Penicillium taxi]KAJ5885505.1 hypothetical protein N7495_010015 [Penicillium taxi]
MIIVTFVSVITLAGIITAAVVSAQDVKGNRYPDYTPLNYHLVDTYQGTSFFDRFNYFSGEDPTYGFVVYVNKETALGLNLTHATNTSAILRVDSTAVVVGGRNSVRIESKSTYDTGLFVFDIIHTPYGCGTWPALWLTDTDNWPNNGEIDILESHNEALDGNMVTLHTTEGCTMNVQRRHTGGVISDNCQTNDSDSGCAVQGDERTYGQKMNENRGGVSSKKFLPQLHPGSVYALELRDAGIRTWFFPRDYIPADINDSTAPDPYTWGIPFADFPNTKCDIPTYFHNQTIIVNIDLCGELAAQPQYYDEMYHCPATCESFVANSPSSFEEAYWEFASFKVYQAA